MSNECPDCGGEINDWGDTLFHILKHQDEIARRFAENGGGSDE